MNRQELLDRQDAIVAYLTNPVSFLGGRPGPLMDGLDPAPLRLMGLMSLEKRMGKIQSILPRTFDYLDGQPAYSVSDFAERFPQKSANRTANAIEFVAYLDEIDGRCPLDPPFLADLARLEGAIAKARVAEAVNGDAQDLGEPPGRYRIGTGVELVRCDFDVRPLFDHAGGDAVEPRRILLAAVPSQSGMPQVFEISPRVYDLLEQAPSWRSLEDSGARDGAAGRDLLDRLATRGLVEMSP